MIVEYLYPDNIQYNLNEKRYYGSVSNLDFNRTGGAKQKGAKGFFRALPSLLITAAISWPVALLGTLGALRYRWEKRWEDDDAKRQRLLPAYWTDYVANRHEKDDKDKKDKNKDEKDNKDNTAVATATGATVGTVAGGLLADKIDDEETPEERKNNAFITYWVTFSNGEIIRLRADNKNNAKDAANTIIKYTKKPCYDVLNTKIQYGLPRYKFYLDSG